ncbi:MAG: hypothetical protein LBQ41_04295 [Candidatus Ancillula sp.]|nr:hypothetical protein [Candidatus Ancillula sp.]
MAHADTMLECADNIDRAKNEVVWNSNSGQRFHQEIQEIISRCRISAGKLQENARMLFTIAGVIEADEIRRRQEEEARIASMARSIN